MKLNIEKIVKQVLDSQIQPMKRIVNEGSPKMEHNQLLESLVRKVKTKVLKENQEADTISMDSPLFTSILEFIRDDENSSPLEISNKVNQLCKEKGILFIDDLEQITGGSESDPEITEAKKDKKPKEEPVEDDQEESVGELSSDENEEEVEANPTEQPHDNNSTVKTIMDSLTAAQNAAKELGDQKLLNQLGNTITFFTKVHIVGNNQETPGALNNM